MSQSNVTTSAFNCSDKDQQCGHLEINPDNHISPIKLCKNYAVVDYYGIRRCLKHARQKWGDEVIDLLLERWDRGA